MPLLDVVFRNLQGLGSSAGQQNCDRIATAIIKSTQDVEAEYEEGEEEQDEEYSARIHLYLLTRFVTCSARVHQEGLISRSPKLVRGVAMGEFADTYNGDIQACLRGLVGSAPLDLGIDCEARNVSISNTVSNLDLTSSSQSDAASALPCQAPTVLYQTHSGWVKHLLHHDKFSPTSLQLPY
ncbi:uncharacterized protein F5147DRAFT_781436 [Suillus discolor]|uniref:Uncharacterized protein n=1 Tax=Suillus discolor TaxID=1912936 RepID=A0A9P7ERN8_9AGAM|nr:uncharacterized protein F5147DRAFT_781436 [Suillus discolor]KAG2087137.1 hypothetical protein F5147DRAFT_781436 [Suillus discolor]